MSNIALLNPAENIISGWIDVGATWYEDIGLWLNGEPLTDVDDHTWALKVYRCSGDSPELTLVSGDGLTVTEDTDITTLSIRCAPSRMSSLCGDYWVDITSTDASPTVDGAAHVYLRGRGTVTFLKGAS